MLLRFFLSIVLFFSFLFSNSLEYKFSEAKKNYIKAVLQNNKQNEIKYLQKIIYYGKLIKKNVKKYEIELSKLKKKKVIVLNSYKQKKKSKKKD